MGAKGITRYESSFQIGKQYGKWTVTGDIILDKEAKVQVTCVCGATFHRSCHSLLVGTSRSCYPCAMKDRSIGGENVNWKGYNNVPGSFTQRYKRKALQSGKEKLTWEITIQDIDALYIAQNKKCALTGLPISFENLSKDYKGYTCTASIDRIDSSVGYIKGNIQLVHKDVNIMKNHFDQDYFIKMCKLVVSNHS